MQAWTQQIILTLKPTAFSKTGQALKTNFDISLASSSLFPSNAGASQLQASAAPNKDNMVIGLLLLLLHFYRPENILFQTALKKKSMILSKCKTFQRRNVSCDRQILD